MLWTMKARCLGFTNIRSHTERTERRADRTPVRRCEYPQRGSNSLLRRERPSCSPLHHGGAPVILGPPRVGSAGGRERTPPLRAAPAAPADPRGRRAGDHRGRRGAAARAAVPGADGRRGDAADGALAAVVLRLLP